MSNFVFSRRTLQRSINRLSGIVKERALLSIVDRLNHPGNARLPATWELVMLDALASIGTLRHETELPTGRRPDFEWVVSGRERELVIVGDIVTVSDAGLDEQNPVRFLAEHLRRFAAKAGLDPNHIGFNVRGGRLGPYRDSRVRLFLPGKEALLQILRREVVPWIQRLKAAPDRPDRFDCVKGNVDFSVTYDPSQVYASGGYLRYDVAASRDRNPLFRALKAKVAQLKQARHSALRLIVACDGDCALLHSSVRSPGTFTAHEVAEDFLRQNRSIDAVLLVTIEEQRRSLDSSTAFRMKYDLVVARLTSSSERMTPDVCAELDAVLLRAVEHVPSPVQSAYNAAERCRRPGCGPDMMGGWKMNGERVSLSSRGLQRLLAGEMSLCDFMAAHGWNGDRGPSNPFVRMARAGRMITNIAVESAEGQDDDWLTFQFGQPDPAAAPFAVPNAHDR